MMRKCKGERLAGALWHALVLIRTAMWRGCLIILAVRLVPRKPRVWKIGMLYGAAAHTVVQHVRMRLRELCGQRCRPGAWLVAHDGRTLHVERGRRISHRRVSGMVLGGEGTTKSMAGVHRQCLFVAIRHASQHLWRWLLRPSLFYSLTVAHALHEMVLLMLLSGALRKGSKIPAGARQVSSAPIRPLPWRRHDG